jgi:saccharopine dehydrogenase-like NADP-dependent oxidoreductase
MSESKKILVLGAGLVTNPLVQYLLNVPEFEVTVATRTVSKAEAMVGDHPRGKAISFNIEDEEALGSLIADCDLVISLVPWIHHLTVAKLAISLKKQMVTTSYVSPEMKALDTQARDAGIIILNEIGLDPGIDHMSAMEVIHDVEGKGGKVTSFMSNCGGLPSPEATTTPWGYKFSWSPRGVVLAARNSARYLMDGSVVATEGKDLFGDVRHIDVDGLGAYEVYPNRDSMGYQEIYGLNDTKVLFRGTIRNLGHCATWKALSDCGWFELDEVEVEGKTYRKLFAELIKSEGDLKEDLAKFLDVGTDADLISRMEWLGLLSEEIIPGSKTTKLDVLADRLLVKLPYAEGELDMIILQHTFEAEYPDAAKERIVATLVDFGQEGGDSSMARTVSLPAAIATRMILQGEITEKGVHVPVLPGIYQPVLAELAELGIAFKETRESI